MDIAHSGPLSDSFEDLLNALRCRTAILPMEQVRTVTHITKMFKKEMVRAGLPVCRFHDLRHYGASIMHAIGVPDVYIIERGGWSSDHVMKAIYRDSIDAEKRKQTAAINEHFAALVQ